MAHAFITAWSLGVAPTAPARPTGTFFDHGMEHLMFIRAWLDFVTWSVHDPFDYSHGNVWEVAWTNAVEELRNICDPGRRPRLHILHFVRTIGSASSAESP